MGKIDLVILAYRMVKQRRHEEWKARMRSHLSRWDDSMSKLESAKQKVQNNINSNEERLAKVDKFLTSLNSDKSIAWYARTREKIKNLKTGDQVEMLQEKLDDYESKIESAEHRKSLIETWISEGHQSVRDIDWKINDLNGQIRDVEK